MREDDDHHEDLEEQERQAIIHGFDLVEKIYGSEFREVAEHREPDTTTWVLEEGIETLDGSERLGEQHVPQIAEVVATKTLGSTKTYFYNHFGQDPFERSVYGI